MPLFSGKSQNKSFSLDAFLVLKCSVSQLTEGFPAHFPAQPPQTICNYVGTKIPTNKKINSYASDLFWQVKLISYRDNVNHACALHLGLTKFKSVI